MARTQTLDVGGQGAWWIPCLDISVGTLRMRLDCTAALALAEQLRVGGPATAEATSWTGAYHMSHPASPQDHVRWARCVCEVMREMWQRSEPSAWPAHLEIIAKLQARFPEG